MKLFKNLTMKMEKKCILFYERLASKIVLIENTKLFFFLGVCIYNLSKKKVCKYVCIYNKNVCVCVYLYVCGSCLDKYISVVTWPLQT